VTQVNQAVQTKTPLTSELFAQLKDLQDKYRALENENKRNKAIINQLESKVRQFEENDSLNIDKHP
jgi:predicted RNase H-like nuclease (RuvC/YqgF family)